MVTWSTYNLFYLCIHAGCSAGKFSLDYLLQSSSMAGGEARKAKSRLSKADEVVISTDAQDEAMSDSTDEEFLSEDDNDEDNDEDDNDDDEDDFAVEPSADSDTEG